MISSKMEFGSLGEKNTAAVNMIGAVSPAARLMPSIPPVSIPGMAAKVKEKVLTVFTRQLAQLTSAGLPLLTGLKVLEKQEKDVLVVEKAKRLMPGLSTKNK